jgi:hypothetical protein
MSRAAHTTNNKCATHPKSQQRKVGSLCKPPSTCTSHKADAATLIDSVNNTKQSTDGDHACIAKRASQSPRERHTLAAKYGQQTKQAMIETAPTCWQLFTLLSTLLAPEAQLPKIGRVSEASLCAATAAYGLLQPNKVSTCRAPKLAKPCLLQQQTRQQLLASSKCTVLLLQPTHGM